MRIQSYEIIQKIGVGGMGVVYKARHIFSNKIVAIKSLSPQYCDDNDIRIRFKNEAYILSKLDHPNIVKVIDFLELPNELHLIMEYVEGRTLDKIIGQEVGPIPYQRALPIFNQILDGISYAHSKGIIHRDIKPSNIIVTPDNKVKITDFGIAKLQDASQHTRTGTRMGTLYYMSPEQIIGDKNIDHQSDIYSLGITLFEMLSGRLPFGKKGELTEFEIMQKIVNEPLPDPRDFYPAIPERFVIAINKATEKNKNIRLKSIEELREIINQSETTFDEVHYENFRLLKTIHFPFGPVISVAFSPDGKFIASGSDDYTIKLWDIKSRKLIKTFERHNDSVWSVAFSPDGKFIASGSEDKTIKLWDVKSGELIKTFKGHYYIVYSVAFSPDGKFLASGSEDATIKLWDVNSGELIKTFEGHNSDVNSVAFSPDGKFIASGSRDTTIKLWDIKSRKLIKTFERHNDSVWSVAFSPDGKFIASGSPDETIKLWDVNSGELIKTFEGHNSDVNSVAFSPDGKFIASGSFDKTIKLWDVNSGKLIKAFREHNDIALSVAFSPDGKYLVSGGYYGGIYLFGEE